MTAVKSYTSKVQKHGNSLLVAIPRPLLHALGLSLGDHVALQQVDDCLAVMPMEKLIRERMSRSTPLVHAVVARGEP